MRRAVAALLLVLLAGCARRDAPGAGPAPSSGPEFPPAVTPYDPHIDPDDFVSRVTNPWSPLKPGTTFVYRGKSDGERERIEVFVTGETRQVMGVTCVVVRDVAVVGGEIHEKTFDWFAQDRYGNVWYFGEDTKEYEDGKVSSTAGAWEAGVDGALPGIVMLGDPDAGERYRQELYRGEAMDMARVLRVDATAAVPYGEFDDVLVTRDWNPLEPRAVEHKHYARGVGLVLEEAVQGPPARVRLVSIRHGRGR